MRIATAVLAFLIYATVFGAGLTIALVTYYEGWNIELPIPAWFAAHRLPTIIVSGVLALVSIWRAFVAYRKMGQ